MKLSAEQIREILKIKSVRYVSKNGVIMDAKPFPNEHKFWAILGNCWDNIFTVRPFIVYYEEIVRDGWRRVK